VIITVIGTALVHAVSDILASMLEVEASSLVLRCASPSSYLLMLPDVSSVNQLVSLQQPFRSSDFSLLCKKWSQLAGATGKAMPCKMDVEVKGIPVHVWETSTVEQLLNPYAWIDHVHEATSELSDLSSFQCSAWCFDSNKIPPSKELWVAEPPNTILESPPVKRFFGLSYQIQDLHHFPVRGSCSKPTAFPSP
jgi:hypothetical protein